MRYCTQCHHITLGKALFCNVCGSSYDVKLCPSRHVNPRTAAVCSQCGSHDLSTPAPRVSPWVRIVLWSAPVLAGLLLILLSLLALAALLDVVVSSQEVPPKLAAGVLLLAGLWLCYLHFTISLKGLFHTIWRNAKKDR